MIRREQFTILLLLVFSLFGCSDNSDWQTRSVSSIKKDFYTDQIKPILDNRCVTCHSCFNSPCQLNLASYDGFDRGANKKNIYDMNIIKAQRPTRLFEDATTTQQWQSKKYGFYPIYKKIKGKIDLENSIFHHLLDLKKKNPDALGEFNATLSRSCPKINFNNNSNPLKQILKYKKENPWGGMPYGFPELNQSQKETIYTWLDQGAPGPLVSNIEDSNHDQIEQWELFLNTDSPKNRLTARYIYEHLFLAHIYFNNSSDSFYKIIRTTNKAGIPDIIATRTPLDDPKIKQFYYRLRKVTSTIVNKTHFTFSFSQKKLERYKELFIKSDWNRSNITFPSYDRKVTNNPLLAFEQIPAAIRYQFLLEDARYFVLNFLKGPACRGHVALGVIDDKFLIVFLDSKSDLFTTNTQAMNAIKPYATTPALYGSHLNIKSTTSFYLQSKSKKNKLRIAKNKMLNKYKPNGYRVSDIWNGEQKNDNALLTVFRHKDSATVEKGALGENPKTVWVIDYQILEDLYYNLVAGFDIFGTASHQAMVRIQTDSSRINSQDNFIDMLPKSERVKLRFDWSRNKDSSFTKKYKIKKKTPNSFKQIKTMITRNSVKKMQTIFPYLGSKRKTQVQYKTKDFSKELINKILNERLSWQLNKFKNVTKVVLPDEKISKAINSFKDFDKEVLKVFGVKSIHNSYFPDLSLLRVVVDGKNDRAYSIVHNKEHWNVSFIFNEQSRRRYEHDTLNLLPTFVGSYPNYFFKVDFSNLSTFLNDIRDISSKKDYLYFINKYGIKRMNDKKNDFWKEFDFFNNYYKKINPIEYGLLDLNRYLND